MQKFLSWREEMTRIEITTNVAKNKVMANGKKAQMVRSGRCPCDVYGEDTSQNSILYTVCGIRCHNRRSGLRSINNVPKFLFHNCKSHNELEKPHNALHL